MSWSASTPEPIGVDDIRNIACTPQTAPDGVEAAFAEQWEVAQRAAVVLAQAIGRGDDLILVSMSGHANPDHAPYPGWADEMITISVRSVPVKEA